MASFGGNLCYSAVTTHLAKHTFVCGYQTFFFLLDLGRWIQQIWKESKGCVKKEHFCLPRINTGKGELFYCNVASLGLIIILMMILIILVIICVLSCVALLPCELGVPGNFS